jgi:hypothetical protein
MRPNGRRHAPVALDDLGQVAAERMRSQEPGRMNRRRLEHDQADPPARPSLVVSDEVFCRPVVVDERRLVGGRDDPVRQLDRPELERREDVFHAMSIRSRCVEATSGERLCTAASSP